MLQVNPDSWHARLYLWSHTIWWQFWHKRNRSWYEDKRENTNVCYYLRVMLMYAPLVIILHAALLAATVGVVVVLPIHLFGFWGVGKATFVIFLLVALGVGLAIGLGVLAQKAGDAAIDASQRHREMIHEQGGLTFWEVVRARISGAKHKICPLIRVARPEQTHE